MPRTDDLTIDQFLAQRGATMTGLTRDEADIAVLRYIVPRPWLWEGAP
jgi:NADPH-dependent glutamate synthase beta subunit-like oxidoreductase